MGFPGAVVRSVVQCLFWLPSVFTPVTECIYVYVNLGGCIIYIWVCIICMGNDPKNGVVNS